MLSLVVLTFFVVAQAQRSVRLGRTGYNSVCFDQTFDRTFTNPDRRGMLTVGMDAIVEDRYRNQVTEALIRTTMATANGLWRKAGIQFSDIQIEYRSGLSDNQGQTDNFFNRWTRTWEGIANEKPHRLTMIFSHIGTLGRVSTGGALFNGVGQMAGRRGYIWMNIDGFNNGGRGGWYTDRTLQHELGHAIGLFHTFQSDFGCVEGDIVDDTSITPQAMGVGCRNSIAGCDGQTKQRDTENLMSYGSCNGAKKVTDGQLRRVRCAFENHISWRLISNAPRTAPQPPMTPTAPSGPSGYVPPRGVGTVCRGTGRCVDSSRPGACEHTLFSRSCPGPSQVLCCQNTAARPASPATPPSGAMPGEGMRCLGAGYTGVCYNNRTHRCGSGRVLQGACAGASNIRCCITGRAKRSVEEEDEVIVGESNTALVTSTEDEEIPDSDLFPTPNPNDVYHVGDTITVDVSVPLFEPKVYLVRRTDVSLKIDDAELTEPGLIAGASQDSADLFKFHVPLNTVDRGSYAIVIKGKEVNAENQVQGDRTLVSEVFVVDVNSCAIDVPTFGAPYGLIRQASACTEREGRVASTLANGLVCCAPEIVSMAVTQPAIPTEEEMTMMSGMMNQMDEQSEIIATPEPISLGEFSWTGYTSFWGAPMQLVPVSKTDFAVTLIAAGSDADIVDSVPATVFTSNANAQTVSFTPKVASPTAVAFATQDLVAQTSPFSVVSLPCRLTSGQAGYCRPTAAILSGLGDDTPDELVCSNGEAAQCAGLAVDGVSFACCPGSASALQQTAVYRKDLANLNAAGSIAAEEGSTEATTPSSAADLSRSWMVLAAVAVAATATL